MHENDTMLPNTPLHQACHTKHEMLFYCHKNFYIGRYNYNYDYDYEGKRS